MIKTFEGHQYKIGTLDVMIQFHIARRLAPLLANLGTAAIQKLGAAKLSDGKFGIETVEVILGPIAQTLATMSDADSEYIINNCLAVTQRENKPAGFVPVMAGINRRMFEDMKLTEVLGITLATIEENLGDFFPTGEPSSPAAS